MPESWTYIVDEPRRTELLKGYGLSNRVIGLGVDGDWSHEAFGFCCRKPMGYSDDPNEESGDVVVGIFETDRDESFSCRKRGDILEFVSFELKDPLNLKVLGTSIQSLLAVLFEDLVQSEGYNRWELKKAATCVGFEHLQDLYDFMMNALPLGLRGYDARLLEFVLGLSKN